MSICSFTRYSLYRPVLRSSFTFIAHYPTVYRELEFAKVLWVIMAVFEHVWCEDWVPGVLSGNVESEVTMFIDFRDLVGSSPDGLQFLRQVFLPRSSLVHD